MPLFPITQIPPKPTLKGALYLPGSTLLGWVGVLHPPRPIPYPPPPEPFVLSLSSVGNRVSCVLTHLELANQQVKRCLEAAHGVHKSESPFSHVPFPDATLGAVLDQCPFAHRLCLRNKGLSEWREGPRSWMENLCWGSLPWKTHIHPFIKDLHSHL